MMKTEDIRRALSIGRISFSCSTKPYNLVPPSFKGVKSGPSSE